MFRNEFIICDDIENDVVLMILVAINFISSLTVLFVCVLTFIVHGFIVTVGMN